MLSTKFACILSTLYSALCVMLIISMTFTLIEGRKQAKRNAERELRDIEYHKKRMKDLK